MTHRSGPQDNMHTCPFAMSLEQHALVPLTWGVSATCIYTHLMVGFLLFQTYVHVPLARCREQHAMVPLIRCGQHAHTPTYRLGFLTYIHPSPDCMEDYLSGIKSPACRTFSRMPTKTHVHTSPTARRVLIIIL